jgi:uncharacterized protein (DUF779 family)
LVDAPPRIRAGTDPTGPGHDTDRTRQAIRFPLSRPRDAAAASSATRHGAHHHDATPGGQRPHDEEDDMSDDQQTTTETTTLQRALHSRAVITTAAARVLHTLRQKHGRVIFHQSGGCCEGSGPSCFAEGSYIVSPLDRLLGVVLDGSPEDVEGTPVWISATQFAAWEHSQVVIDVTEGMAMGGFSLEGPEGYVFLSRARIFTDEQNAALPSAPTKAEVDAGAARPEPLPPVDLTGDFGAVCALPEL